MTTPVKAVALKLAERDASVANWYARLATAAPEITWGDVDRLRTFTPRRTINRRVGDGRIRLK